MRIVEANPEKPIRTVNMVGYGWLLLLVASFLHYSSFFSIPNYIYLSYPAASLLLIIHIAWYTPNDWEKPFYTTHSRILLFVCIPLIASWISTQCIGQNNTEPFWNICSMLGIVFLFFGITFVWFTIVYMIINRVRCFKKENACESCGYNLTGNISGRCPECGTPIVPIVEFESDDSHSQRDDATQTGDSGCSS